MDLCLPLRNPNDACQDRTLAIIFKVELPILACIKEGSHQNPQAILEDKRPSNAKSHVVLFSLPLCSLRRTLDDNISRPISQDNSTRVILETAMDRGVMISSLIFNI